jgi:hypothetical protein
VPLCNETDLFISQSLKEKIWGLQYINLALLLHQNFATFAKLQKASVHDSIFSIFFTLKFLFSVLTTTLPFKTVKLFIFGYAPAHTNTIGVQADNNVINGEDFISENTPLNN